MVCAVTSVLLNKLHKDEIYIMRNIVWIVPRRFMLYPLYREML